MSAKFPRGGEQTHSQPSVYMTLNNTVQLLTNVEVDMKGYLLNSKLHTDRREVGANMIQFCSITLHVYRNISQQVFYYMIKIMFCIPCQFGSLKPLTSQLDNAKLRDVMVSLPEIHAI